MTAVVNRRWIDFACVGALAALSLMTWQLFDPTVWPVMVAMSVGQVLGTASFAAFGYVVFADYRAQRSARRTGSTTDPPATSTAGSHPPTG